MTWRFADPDNAVVTRATQGGGTESVLASTLDAETLASVLPYVAPPLSGVDVDAERDRRMAYFSFGGVAYDFDEASRSRIDKARGRALAAILAGAQAGDYRWADASIDFGWITASNAYTLMDAQTCLAFGNSAASWEGRHIIAARSIKNMSPIPADYATNDERWP